MIILKKEEMKMKITVRDIKERSMALSLLQESSSKVNIQYLFKNIKTRYNYNNAKTILENWSHLSKDEDIAIGRVLETFDAVCDNDSISNINNASKIIESNILHKVRSGKATRHLNNYKLGKFKIANTKMQNANNDNNNANSASIQNKGNLPNSLHPNRKYKYNLYGERIGDKKEKPVDKKEQEEKDKVVEECCNRMIEVCKINEQCDRVLSNHEKLCKRFNMDNKVRTCQLNEDALKDCVMELCEMIDSYDIPFGVKYNIALENILYLMNKNSVMITESFITESVTDYFLLTNNVNDDIIHDMKYIIENSKFYNKEDFECISYIFGEHTTNITKTEEALDALLEEQKAKKNTIKDELNKFKMSHEKSIEGLRKCVTRIFVNSPENIIKDLPDIFGVVRAAATLGVFAINPILGIINLITSGFLKMTIKRNEMKRVTDQYRKEIDRYNKKLKEAKSEKAKEKYNATIKKLKSDLEKLDEYESSLYTEKENDKRNEDKYSSSDDDDFNFDESAGIESVQRISTLVESMNWNSSDLMTTIRKSIKKLDDTEIETITEGVILCSDIFDIDKYEDILESERDSLRRQEGIDKYIKIDSINSSLHSIKENKYQDLVEDANDNSDIVYEHTRNTKEVVDDIVEILQYHNSNSMLEEKGGISLTSKMKLATEQLKRTAINLKGKEKTLSNKIDVSMSQVTSSAEKALINNNREAVIKGSLIPSASKCIKAAIVTGAAWLVSPAVAVIGLLGSIAMSKKLQKKERQLILDDIDVELNMCERYIKLAEDKNDMKAIRNLMQTKRALQRQQQRLKYNMTVNWNEKVPNVAKDDSYDEGAVTYDEKYVALPGMEVNE
jgi:hypothetical protein